MKSEIKTKEDDETPVQVVNRDEFAPIISLN